MSESLSDILAGRVPQEPPEVAIIKHFVRDEFQAACGVSISQQQIVIQVRSAALAGALRPHLHTLKAACKTSKRLMVRIGEHQ